MLIGGNANEISGADGNAVRVLTANREPVFHRLADAQKLKGKRTAWRDDGQRPQGEA
jgi:hypothetical protein